MPARLLLLLLAASGLGCEPRLTLGGRCARSSECDDGLVCGIGGYCREECITSRDCTLGARCLPDPDTDLRACSIASLDDGCTPGSCARGLLCVEGVCLALCGAGGDCPDGVCDETTCSPPTPTGDAGTTLDASAPDGSRPAGCPGPGERIVDVAVGYAHACAVTESGAVWCWGEATGTGSDATPPGCTGSCFPRAVRVEDASGALQNVDRVVAGRDVSCALLDGDEVRCWGEPMRVGGPAIAGSRHAVVVEVGGGAHLTGVREIRGGGLHTCAVRSDGHLSCWGNGESGQLGTGGTSSSLRAVAASALPANTDFLVVAAYRTLVIDGGMLTSVGENDDGELGGTMETATPSATPVLASRVSGATMAVATAENTCVVVAGAISCWGRDTAIIDYATGLDGCGGTCTVEPRDVPIEAGITIAALAGDPLGDVVIGRSTDDALIGWGSNYGGILDPAPGLSAVTRVSLLPSLAGRTTSGVAIGRQVACAIVEPEGEVWCWGIDEVGQLGRGTTGFEDAMAAPVCW